MQLLIKLMLSSPRHSHSQFWISCSVPFGLLALRDLQIIWLFNLLIMSVPDEGLVRTKFYTRVLIFYFYYQIWRIIIDANLNYIYIYNPCLLLDIYWEFNMEAGSDHLCFRLFVLQLIRKKRLNIEAKKRKSGMSKLLHAKEN